MGAVDTTVAAIWVVFWCYWLVSALGAKKGSRRRARPWGLVIVVVGWVLIRAPRGRGLAVHDPALRVVGMIVFVSGLAVAVWARIHLGRNWGMPMTRKDEPELVTSGPYRVVRHPIYTGLLLGLLGTALAVNLYWLVAVGVAGAYFFHSARVEERMLAATFPSGYARYRARTKMLIPFVL